MAIDPEELDRRRQKREAYRQERRAKKRKLRLRILIAAVVLIGCGVLIFTMKSPRTGQPEQTQPPVETEPPQTEQTQPEGTLPPTTTIRLALAGDLNVNDRVVASGGGNYDYTNTFMDVLPVLAEADLTVVNLEGNLVGSPYGSSSASAPMQMMEALRTAGVDMIQLANSYAIHNGVSGLQSTINGVYAAGMEPLGVYADEDAFRAGKGYTIRSVDGIDVAFVAFTKGMDGMALPAGSENCVNLLYKDYDSTYQSVDTERITKILSDTEKASPDITVALLHWGSEFNNSISSSQEKIAKLMFENGVDVIVGTHSHYVQQVIYDRAAGTLLAYSLGDFCSDSQRAGSEYSVVLEVEITKENATGNTTVSGWSYTPIFSINEKDKPMRVVRLQQAMKAYEANQLGCVGQATYEDMKYAMGRIEARIAGE